MRCVEKNMLQKDKRKAAVESHFESGKFMRTEIIQKEN
jgi:hypothetical protein